MKLTDSIIILIQESVDARIIQLNKELKSLDSDKDKSKIENLKYSIGALKETANYLENRKVAYNNINAQLDVNNYVLSVWKNHKSPKEWLYDVSPLNDYFRNSLSYLTEYKEPYYYTPIIYGSQDLCSRVAQELRAQLNEALSLEEQTEIIKRYFTK